MGSGNDAMQASRPSPMPNNDFVLGLRKRDGDGGSWVRRQISVRRRYVSRWGGWSVAAPVGVPAGAAHGRGLWHGLDLPGAATAGPIPTIPEFEDPRFDRIEIGVIRYHASAAAIIDNNTDSTHVAFVHSGSFGADQDPRVPVGSVKRSAFGISISYGEMPVARTPTSEQPGTRRSVTEMWLPFVQVRRMHYSDASTHILAKGCCPAQDGVTDVHLTVQRPRRLDRPAIHHRLRTARRTRGQSRPRNASRGLPPRPEAPGPHQARPAGHRLPPRPHRLPRRPELEGSEYDTAGLAASANALRRSGCWHGRSFQSPVGTVAQERYPPLRRSDRNSIGLCAIATFVHALNLNPPTR